MIPYRDEESADEAEPTTAEPEDIEALKQALTEEKEKAEKYLASWQRAEADLVNYKRHSEQEKQELGRFANTSLMLNILPVLDDLERAFDALPPRTAKQDWVAGLKLVPDSPSQAWCRLREVLQ